MKDITKPAADLTEKEIDQIVERYSDQFTGQWNNFTHLRILCMDAYEAERKKGDK
jgi:hypothetical protein